MGQSETSPSFGDWLWKLREAIADEMQDANWNMERQDAQDRADCAIANAGTPPRIGSAA